jgi:transposase
MAMLQQINPRAAAADVGSESIYVSIAGAPPVRFGTVTKELHRLRDHLLAHHVDTIAMEFTGVYWVPLYELLENSPIRACLFNGAQVKALPGRKTDVADSQWAATLHSHGLIRSGFVPAAPFRVLRDYLRLRESHLGDASSSVLRMQKAMELMNIKVHDVISDITGASGRRVVQAILDGERDPERLLDLCETVIIKKKGQRMRDALEGTWAKQHLFALQQAWDAFQFCQAQAAACDAKVGEVLREMAEAIRAERKEEAKLGDGGTPPEGGEGVPGQEESKPKGRSGGKKMGKNAPKILDLESVLSTVLGGRRPQQIPGLTPYTTLTLVSEIGTDLSAFRSAKSFTSWLGLAPGQRQSGKRRRNQSRKGARAGQIFRMIAQSVGNGTKMGLGDFYRRLRAAKGGLIACKALGRKLAVLYYNVMTKGVEFVEEGLQKAQEKYKEQAIARLERLAKKVNMAVVPIAATEGST